MRSAGLVLALMLRMVPINSDKPPKAVMEAVTVMMSPSAAVSAAMVSGDKVGAVSMMI